MDSIKAVDLYRNTKRRLASLKGASRINAKNIHSIEAFSPEGLALAA